MCTYYILIYRNSCVCIIILIASRIYCVFCFHNLLGNYDITQCAIYRVVDVNLSNTTVLTSGLWMGSLFSSLYSFVLFDLYASFNIIFCILVEFRCSSVIYRLLDIRASVFHYPFRSDSTMIARGFWFARTIYEGNKPIIWREQTHILTGTTPWSYGNKPIVLMICWNIKGCCLLYQILL